MGTKPESNGHLPRLGKRAEGIRAALEFYYQPEKPTWDEVAAHVGASREAVRQWRMTEEWEITERQVRDERLTGTLGRAVVNAWVKWIETNPVVFLRTAEHLGLLGAAGLKLDLPQSWLDLIQSEIPEAAIKE